MVFAAEQSNVCAVSVRYLALPNEDRKWFPDELGGRPDLCTCGTTSGSTRSCPSSRTWSATIEAEPERP